MKIYKILFKFLNHLKSTHIIISSHRGFGFAETLIVTGVISILLAATTNVAFRAMSVSNAVQAVSSENELQFAIAHILADDEYCKDNLTPTAGKLVGPDASLGVGTITQLTQNTTPLIEVENDRSDNVETTFKGNLYVVQMSLESPTPTPQDPKAVEVERDFRVFYSMRGIGPESNTIDGQKCFNDVHTGTIDTTGCYSTECTLRYRLDSSNNVTTCKLLNCTDRARLGKPAEEFVDLSCYTVEKEDRKRLLVGCGSTQDLGGTETMAMGNDLSNITITGRGNAFMGHQVAYNATVSGNRNTFAGYRAGQQVNINSSAFASIFLGYRAGYLAILQGVTQGNAFFGSEAGRSANINGGRGHTFIGYQSGRSASLTNTEGNIFLGYRAGQSATVTGKGNTFLGAQSGRSSNVSGDYNTLLGYGAGYNRTITDSRLINIGNLIVAKQAATPNIISSVPPTPDSTVGYVSVTGNLLDCPPNNLPQNLTEPPPISGNALYTTAPYDLKKRRTSCMNLTPREHDAKHRKLYVGVNFPSDGKHTGNLKICYSNGTNCRRVSLETHIHKKLELSSSFKTANTGGSNQREVSLANHTHTHFAEHGHFHGNSLYGDARHTHPYAHSSHCSIRNQPTTNIVSSRKLKKDITPFTDYDEALEHIINTPLFTYQFKDKDKHPDKQRMGIISEELPESLQIQQQGGASHPDWPSIYGTFWASLKALSNKFNKLKDHITSELQNITQQNKQLGNEISSLHSQISKLESNMTHSQKELTEWKTNFIKDEKDK